MLRPRPPDALLDVSASGGFAHMVALENQKDIHRATPRRQVHRAHGSTSTALAFVASGLESCPLGSRGLELL